MPFIPLRLSLPLAALFLGLGVVFSCGRGGVLIIGYNVAPESEKAGIDEKKLCRFMGKYMLLLAACCLITVPGELCRIPAFLWLGVTGFYAVILVCETWMGTGNRFQKKNQS